MRHLLLAVFALATLASCKISDAHFRGPGVFDDAPLADDSMMSMSDGRNVDAPPGIPLTHGYAIDQNVGIFQLGRDPTTNALTVQMQYPGNFQPYDSLIVVGSFLYVFSGDTVGRVTTYAIAANGGLSEMGTVGISGACTQPRSAQLYPGGNWIGVTCLGGKLAFFPGAGSAVLGNPQPGTSGPQQSPGMAFLPTGGAVLTLDPSASIINDNIFDPATGFGGVLGGGKPTPPGPVDVVSRVNGKQVYTIGGTSPFIQGYDVLTDNTLAVKTPNTPLNAQATGLSVSPNGQYLFAVGSQVSTFTFDANGNLVPVSGTPTTPLPGLVVSHAVFDPATPDAIFLVDSSGVASATLANGIVTNAANTVIGNGSVREFVLAK